MKALIALLILSSLVNLGNAQVADCFYQHYMQYAYDVPDNSGNYSLGYEYWMKANTSCTFLV